MANNLVIVESPAKANTIGKFLGKDYKIVASVGHVRDLPKSQIGVDVEHDFEPKYITIRGKGDVINKLKKEAKSAGKVYLATDPDREGEAISWHLAALLNIDGSQKCRITFNEITKNAVKNAIKAPRSIDMGLVDAQQARRILDRIVGYKISPLLWKKVRKGLSAGRVQSVATRMICDREDEIEKFTPAGISHNIKSHLGLFSHPIYFLPLRVFLYSTFAPHFGQLTPASSSIGLAFLHSGKPGHARNFPYLPVFITIFRPHFSHFISVSSS